MYTSHAIMATPSFKEGIYHGLPFKGGTLFVPVFGTLLHSRRHLSRAAFYNKPSCRDRDADVIRAINAEIDRHPRWGFWKTFKGLRHKGHRWNHKRVSRVYCKLKLNQKRRAKKRLPKLIKRPLLVPPNQVWPADFMSDTLYTGKRFRTFNVIDDLNRKALWIEIDTSLTCKRLFRVFERLRL
jgi:putative transposase